MQSSYPETFERDMACTESEWLGWLPAAVGDCSCVCQDGVARVAVGPGHLQLAWSVQAPRVIALIRLPRLRVSYAFSGVPEAERTAFMRRFDLYTQRGGG